MNNETSNEEMFSPDHENAAGKYHFLLYFLELFLKNYDWNIVKQNLHQFFQGAKMILILYQREGRTTQKE